MAYIPLNPSIKRKTRTDVKAKKRAMIKVISGQRWEFIKGMHGNIVEVRDHLMFRYYRQDHETLNGWNIVDGFLPFYCDYCQKIVNNIVNVRYTIVYEYLVRAKLDNPSWLKSNTQIVYSCCTACENGPLPLSPDLIGYHTVQLYENEKLLFSQDRKK